MQSIMGGWHCRCGFFLFHLKTPFLRIGVIRDCHDPQYLGLYVGQARRLRKRLVQHQATFRSCVNGKAGKHPKMIYTAWAHEGRYTEFVVLHRVSNKDDIDADNEAPDIQNANGQYTNGPYANGQDPDDRNTNDRDTDNGQRNENSANHSTGAQDSSNFDVGNTPQARRSVTIGEACLSLVEMAYSMILCTLQPDKLQSIFQVDKLPIPHVGLNSHLPLLQATIYRGSDGGFGAHCQSRDPAIVKAAHDFLDSIREPARKGTSRQWLQSINSWYSPGTPGCSLTCQILPRPSWRHRGFLQRPLSRKNRRCAHVVRRGKKRKDRKRKRKENLYLTHYVL